MFCHLWGIILLQVATDDKFDLSLFCFASDSDMTMDVDTCGDW